MYGNKSALKCFVAYDEYKTGIIPLCIILNQINAYVKNFDKNNQNVNLLVHGKELIKNIIKNGLKLKVYLTKKLIVNQYIMINTLKLK